MTKAKLLLVLAFVIVCAAGGVVGTAVDRQLHPPVAVPTPHDPLHLNLTADQQAQMKKIWGTFDETRHKLFVQRREYADDRRAAFEALLTPEQSAQYQKIQSEYDAKVKELDEQARHAGDLAVAESDKVLTPEQRQRFHQMRDRMHGPPGMGMPRPRRGGDHHHPTTAPATQPHGDSL